MNALIRKAVVVVLSALWMSGCQIAGETDLDAPADAGPPLEAAVVGTGDTTMVLALPFAGSDAAVARQIRNGAILAHEMLSGDQLALAIANENNPDYASYKNPALVAVYAPSDKAPALPGKNSVTVNLGGAPLQPGGFSLLASETDSLIAGLRYAAPSGSLVVILAPESQSDSSLQDIAKSIGGSVDIVKYKPTASGEDLVKLLGGAEEIFAVGFVESDEKVAEAADALKKKKVTPVIVGHSGWGTNLVRNPKLEGAIIARPDRSASSLVAERYQTKYGSAPSEMSLYGFDLVAIASGLVRKNGKNGISRKNLLTGQGFIGTSGAFRFRENGTVERLYEINKIVGGKLKVIQSAPAGF
jgi:hypothetical protein